MLIILAHSITSEQKAPLRFKLGMSCLLDRRFNQLKPWSHVMPGMGR